ncbi:hypothetical protein CWO01_14860 [Vibrio splendidus]|uniref:glycosyltransferase family 2 protein n=1 Tax=Vibrio splendidus TaxID=29497 RepID=UPI000D3AD161|nr:glycosyltransferase [Vibrio splendidus]PTP60928.1 hypothetical protein CWO01_14860 [Vibrio splendidus]
MNDSIKISVVIPLFNKEDSIVETITSVLNQTFTDYELIIINDGSTDNSLEQINKINNSRIKVYSKENGGVSDTRNYGIDKAQGEFVFLLDADDIIRDDCLEILYNLTNLYPSESVFCGNFNIVDKEGVTCEARCKINSRQLVTDTFKELWIGGIFLRTGNVLIRNKCFEDVGGFNVRFSFYEDMEHVLNLLRKYNVVYDPEVIFTYQLEHNYLSSKKIPINRDWACFACFKGKSFYEKFIIGEVIYSSFIKRYRCKDYAGCLYLFNKHKFNLHYIFISKILKKMLIR